MSNSKNKTEKAAAEKAAPRKRAAPKKSQRVAEVETEENVTHTIAPVHTTVTVSEPVVETVEHITIPQVEEEVKQRAVGMWGKVKAWWGKWGWIPVLAILVTAILFIYLYIQSGKSKRAAKETQQTEQQQQDARDRMQQSETNLTRIQHNRVDSNYEAALAAFEKARLLYEAYHSQKIEESEQDKIKYDALKKRFANADTTALLQLGKH